MPRPLWQDPYAAQSIELLQAPARARASAVEKIGEAQARAAEQTGNANANAQLQSGAAWANGIQQAGNAVASIPGQIQQAQQASRAAAMQNLQMSQMQRQATAADRLDETKQQLSSMMQSPDIYGEDGTINVKTLLSKMGGPLPNGDSGPTRAPDAATVYGLIDPINESLLKARASANVASQHRNDVVGRMADTILQFAGSNPDSLFDNVKLGTGALVKAGIITPNQADEMIGPMIENPDAIPAILGHLKTLGTPTKPIAGKPGEVFFDENTRQPIPGMSVPEKQEPGKGDYTINGQRFKADGTPIGTVQPSQTVPATPSLQSENVLLDGKPSKVTFNPKTGTYHDAAGNDVSARVKPIPPQASVTIQENQSEAKSIADAIVSGEQPPDMKSLYRLAGPIRAELAKAGYNLTNASLDWEATKKHVLALNSSQQLKLNQSIGALPDLLDSVDTLASQWKAGRFPILNRANLALAKGGAYGDSAATIARQLETQIADVTADLGNVYMGGNSPTDHALKLAGTALSGEWSEKVLHDMVDLAKKNVVIRQNSMRNTGVAGASANNPYAAAPVAAPASGGVKILSITPKKP